MRILTGNTYMIKRARLMKIIFTRAIALVWLINGLFCKLLNFVPRHQMIVSRILGEKYSFAATKVIGGMELLMVVWILSGIKSKLCAYTQIAIVATMVTVESILTPDLLLFGYGNIAPALFFLSVVYVNEFYIKA